MGSDLFLSVVNVGIERKLRVSLFKGEILYLSKAKQPFNFWLVPEKSEVNNEYEITLPEKPDQSRSRTRAPALGHNFRQSVEGVCCVSHRQDHHSMHLVCPHHVDSPRRIADGAVRAMVLLHRRCRVERRRATLHAAEYSGASSAAAGVGSSVDANRAVAVVRTSCRS